MRDAAEVAQSIADDVQKWDAHDIGPEARSLIAATVRYYASEAWDAALTEAADAWQWGGWSAITKPVRSGNSADAVLDTAQAVTRWLRQRTEPPV